jgi:glycosyltransferase involved in cell wall biosynthesis
MKIALWHNLLSGGGKRAMYDQVCGLTSRGHHVEAWCPPTANKTFLPLKTLIKEHIVPLEELPPMGKGPINLRERRAGETGRRMALMEKHCQQCAEEIATGGFDLLLSHPCTSFHVSAIGKYSRLPSVLYLAEPYRVLYEALPQLPWAAPPLKYQPFSMRYWSSLTWELLKVNGHRVQVREELDWVKRFDQVLVNSLFSRESLIRSYNLDSRVCYLGVGTENFKPTGIAKGRFVIGLGNVYINKRPMLAVQTVGMIPPEKRPKLIWVGNAFDPSYRKQIEDEAAKLGVDLTFKILISDDALRELLSQAAVLLYTSQLEPFGYAPLEANACGTAVVGIAEGGVRETITTANGLLVPSASPEELALAVAKFTDDLEFATEFGRKARNHVVEVWSQEKAIDRLEAELKRALEKFGKNAKSAGLF